MLLDYLHPELQIPAQQRILEVIGTGALRRDQLLYLLSSCIQRARVDQVLQSLRKAGYLDTVHLPGSGQAVYLLTKDGLRQLDGVSGRVRTAHPRVSYHLSVANVLVQCIQFFGREDWSWYNKPQDELWAFRRDRGDDERDIKKSMPYISALISSNSGVWWLAVDDTMQGDRQVYEGCKRWIKSIDRLDESLRRVLFVVPVDSRKRYLVSRVKRWSDPRVIFRVTTTAQITEILAEAKVPKAVIL